MNGKTVVITGGNRGIGKEIARILALRRARVIIGCRNTKVAEHTVQELKRSDNIDIIAKCLDLSSFDSIRNFAEDINKNETKVSVLICNAAMAPKTGSYQQIVEYRHDHRVPTLGCNQGSGVNFYDS